MPEIVSKFGPSATPAPSANGRQPTLAEKLREGRRGTDDVEIGHAHYTPGPEDETGSWADVERAVKGVRWLLKQWLPAGMLTGLIGSPKDGKSVFALGALAAPVITGCDWFSGR